MTVTNYLAILRQYDAMVDFRHPKIFLIGSGCTVVMPEAECDIMQTDMRM